MRRRTDDSITERELERLVDTVTAEPEHTRLYDDLIRSSGASITPAETWVLWNLAAQGPSNADVLTASLRVNADLMRDLLADLGRRGYIDRNEHGRLDLTRSGRRTLLDLIEACQQRLSGLIVGHEPADDRERARVLHRLIHAVLMTMPTTRSASGV